MLKRQIKLTCGRCKKEGVLTEGDGSSWIELSAVRVLAPHTNHALIGAGFFDTDHLCGDCADALLNWLKP